MTLLKKKLSYLHSQSAYVISSFIFLVSSVCSGQPNTQTFIYNGNGSANYQNGTIQTFTVQPCVTTITITAVGGAGGTNPDSPNNNEAGGLAASLTGTIPVTPGDVLDIMVAGQGHVQNTNDGAGGGGGTFIWDATTNTLLVVAGGGGGGGAYASSPDVAGPGANGQTDNSSPAALETPTNSTNPNTLGIGCAPGGTGGGANSGGQAGVSIIGGGGTNTSADGGNACGGAGWGENGFNVQVPTSRYYYSPGYGIYPESATTPGYGGTHYSSDPSLGGYGGGAGGGFNGGGGGGGYNGGGGGNGHSPTSNGSNNAGWGGGGGGSYFNGGTATSTTLGTAASNGSVTISWVQGGAGSSAPTLSIHSTPINCNGPNSGSATVTARGGTSPLTYSWAPTGGTDSTATGLTAGTYTATVSNACGPQTISTVIPGITPLTAQPPSETNALCNGGSTGTATETPTGGATPYTYSWSAGSQTTATATGLSVGTYTVTVTDACGDPASTASVIISQPTPLTAGTPSATGELCNGGSNGTATTTPGGGTSPYNYSWNPGGQTTATAAGLGAGAYTVTVIDNNNCTATASITVTAPLAIVDSISVVNALCGGTTGSGTVTAKNGIPPYTYLWSPGGQTTPTVGGLLPGTYTVTVTDNNDCSQSATATIIKLAPVTITTSSTPIYCNGGNTGTATVMGSGGATPYRYLWKPSGQATSTAYGLTAGTYTITVTDANGCPDSSIVIITQPAQAIIAFSSNISLGCSPLCVQFNNLTPENTTNPSSYVWTFGNGDSSHTRNPVYCYQTGGIYSVGLTVTDTAGCSRTLNKINMIQVFSAPNAAFSYSPNPATIISPTIQFTNQSTGPNKIIQWWWTFGDQTDSVTTQQNPVHTYQDTGTYCATLVTTDINGCADTATNCIVIDPLFTLYIPDAFSPNGDGINDVFMAKGQYVKSFEMYIFDRWGEELFHSNNINNGWNGTVKSHSPTCQEDIYVYKILATDYENKQHSYIGNITLIR